MKETTKNIIEAEYMFYRFKYDDYMEMLKATTDVSQIAEIASEAIKCKEVFNKLERIACADKRKFVFNGDPLCSYELVDKG